MANTSVKNKKNTSTKSNVKTAAKNPAKKGASASKKKNDASYKRPIVCVILIVLGVLDILLFIKGAADSFWYKLHCFYFAVFGMIGYVLPILLLFLGIIIFLRKGNKKLYGKVTELMILPLIASSILHVNTADVSLSYFKAIGAAFTNATASVTTVFDTLTGVCGALIGGIFLKIGNSEVLGNIFCILLLFIDLILLFGITPNYLYEKSAEWEKQRIEKRALKQSESAQNQTGEPEEDSAELAVPSIFEKLREKKAAKAERKSVREKSEDAGDSQPGEQETQGRRYSSLDYVNDFYKGKENENHEDRNETVFSDEPNIFAGDTVNVVNEPAEPAVAQAEQIFPAENVPAKPDEKVIPLSKQEAEIINSELDAAVLKNDEKPYIMPPVECLTPPKKGQAVNNEFELKSNGEKLIAALNSFNVQATILDVIPGPTVTRYELSPAPGIKISRFVGLSDDLALHLAAPSGLRIEAPIPNKAAIGVEIPNKNRTSVTFREIIDTPEFKKAKSKLNVGLGKDIAGTAICSDLAKMPHLLVAGTTGSGKSVCLNTMIVSLLYNAKPTEVKLLLIDPKQVEFSVYNGIPHLLVPVVSEPRKAAGALGWAVTEMLNRYKTLNACGVRDIGAYNMLCDEKEDMQKMPQIVIFIDELSDLMTVAPGEVEDSIQRLAQMARAAGMHLVVATQRPSVDVITGVIKANIPSRIALSVTSQIDSRTIIDSAGAEKLMGYGDMLYYPVGVPKPIRVQGSFLSDAEIETVVKFIKAQSASNYDSNVQEEIERQAVAEKKKGSSVSSNTSDAFDGNDDLLRRAVELFIGTPEKASISALQRHLGLGFAKAGRLMDTLEEKGFVGPHEGSKPRKVLVTKAQWYEMNNAGQQDSVQTSESTGEVPVEELLDENDFVPFSED